MLDSLNSTQTHNTDTQEKPKWTKTKITILVTNILAFLTFIAVIVLSYKVRYAIPNGRPSPLDDLVKKFYDALPESLIPDSFAVDEIYRNPATNQAQRGTCWAWSTLYLLETQYRAQGIKQGYLKPDEYVKFSMQAFGAFLGNWCRAHPDTKECHYGNFLKPQPSTDDGQVEGLPIYYEDVENLSKSIVPDAVCPYIETGSPSTDFKCDNLEDALKANPISFKIKSFETAYDTRHIKQLLYTKQRPLGIGIPLGSIAYYVSCDDPNFANLEQCTKKSFLCPDSQTEDKYCAKLLFYGYTSDGTFVSIGKAIRQNSIGGHAMNVVGYNDNWRYNNRFTTDNSVQNSKGCFILHNSWGSGGHSIEYLMGRRTVENEMTQCPNVLGPESWIPATIDCITQNNKDVTKCSNDIERVRGKGFANHADLLNCSHVFAGAATDFPTCQFNHSYVLKRKADDTIDTYELPNGLHSTGFITWSEEDPTPKEVRIETVPYWALNRYLKPVDAAKYPNNDQECGFYALPYQMVENMRRRAYDLFDNFKVSDIEIEFDEHSYARSPESWKYDTKYLNASTYKQHDTVFDGALPFDLVY